MSDFPVIADLLQESNVDTALKNKSQKSGIPMRKLRAIYNRGLAAWRSSHRPGTTANQWAMARVNSVIAGGPARKSDKDLLEAVDRNALTPRERKATPANWLEGVMTEFVHAGLHAEFERQDKLKTKYKVTQFSTGERVANMYLVKSLPGYYCQVNKIEGGAEGAVVWRGNTDTVLSRKPKPGDVEKNAERVFGLLLRALRESKSALPLVESKTDFNEYSLHLGDGVIAELTDFQSTEKEVRLKGNIVDMHGRWPDDEVTLFVYPEKGDTVLSVRAISGGQGIRTRRKHANTVAPALSLVHAHKSKLLSITKELVGIE